VFDRRILSAGLFAAFVLLFFLLPSLANVYTDWLWFGEVGYEQVFLRILNTRIVLGAIVFALAFLTLYLNIRLARGALTQRAFTVFGPQGPRTVAIDMGRLRPLFYIGAFIAAFLIALYASGRWDIWLLARNAVAFGKADPVLGYDISFYLFRLPLLHLIHNLAFMTVLLSAAGVAAVHFAGQGLLVDPQRGVLISQGARRHLSVLAAVLLVLLAVRAWLSIPEILTTQSGIVQGASYTDVYARIPVQWILMAAALIGAGLALYQTRETRLWPVLAAVGIYLGVSILGGLYAFVLQRFVVSPNEQVRETPFIAHSIAGTRAGFALDRIEERPLSGEATLTPAHIQQNATTLDNVPLWNDQPLLDTFGQIQEIRTYYDFVSVDNDRYLIDGQYRQIMLSAREMNSAALPSGTWINERLTFTHGYGLTLGPVNEVTPEGLPVLFIRDLPVTSTSPDLKVEQPAIYFGELSNDHVYVKTRTKEFDYPKGDANVFGVYQGNGGVQLGNFLHRLLFAVRFRSPDTLFSPNLTEESRVLMYRRIAERVRRIAPFLTYDPDPYLSISNGRLVWIQDAYTTSGRYPYSARSAGGINYIRNAVKVTIDAYHGTTHFHLIDAQDPIAATLARAFPDLFKPLAQMPEDLRTRLRYPHAIFALQASMFATFHMTNPATFYNREDQWDIPSLDQGADARPMQPYYTIMKLPGEAEAEYIQMLPYTPRQKDNLAAWMAARSDGEHYGKLVVFQFPKQTVIFGPRQISARISQDQVIAPQITLWNQQGSEVIQGTLLVIPIEESLIYVRPIYLRAAGGRIPEMARVVVAYRNQIVMEKTLDAALARLFPTDGLPPITRAERPSGSAEPERPAASGAAQPSAPAAQATGNLATQAQQHYQRAIDAQRQGDWARYGEEIRQLGDVLRRMNERTAR
jgi:uncharacterized protein